MINRPVDAIVVGASAGGVDAINKIFSTLPRSLPVPVLVVLHVAPHGSIILNAFGPMGARLAIKEAEDKEFLVGGTTYFSPPNYHLLVEADRSLSLSVEEPVHYARPSIDVLFESAADVYGDRLLGILLTGANDDGAAGLHRIHQAGGITMVQDPSTAHSSLMPQSALKIFRPTYVQTLTEMAEVLRNLAESTALATATEGGETS